MHSTPRIEEMRNERVSPSHTVKPKKLAVNGEINQKKKKKKKKKKQNRQGLFFLFFSFFAFFVPAADSEEELIIRRASIASHLESHPEGKMEFRTAAALKQSSRHDDLQKKRR